MLRKGLVVRAMLPNRNGSTARANRVSHTIVTLTILLLVMPVLIDLVTHHTSIQKRLFAYAAPDTFYYLTVARNIGLHGQFSFDGKHLSNGYHPFWQILTALPYALRLPGANSPWVLAYLLGITLGLQAAALSVWSRIFRRADGGLSWLFTLLPAGVYALLVSPAWLVRSTEQLNLENFGEGAQPVYGSLWSYLNGMETSLVLFFYALVSWLGTRERPFDRPVALGLAFAGLVFARLDHVFIALPLLVGLTFGHFCEKKTWRKRLAGPAMTTLMFVLPIVVYLLLNHFFIGSAMPTSGRAKTTFPFMSIENFNNSRRVFNSILSLQFLRLDEHWRSTQLTFPVLFAFVTPFIVMRVRMGRGRVILTWAGTNPRRGAWLLLTACGILCLHTYDFFFVYLYGIGHWYVPVSTLFTSLVCLHGAERLRHAWLEHVKRREPMVRGAAIAGLLKVAIPIVTVASTASLFLLFQRTPNYHERYAGLAVDHGPSLRQFVHEKKAQIIDCDDGIVAWVSDVPAMSGTGFGLDPDALLVKNTKSGLLPFAMARGYTYAATLVYADTSKLKNNSSKEILSWMSTTGAFSQLGNLKDYAWAIPYQTPNREFVIVQATPLGSATKPQDPKKVK